MKEIAYIITKAFTRLVSETSESRTFRTLAAKTTVDAHFRCVQCAHHMECACMAMPSGPRFRTLHISAWGSALSVLD